MVPKDIWRSPYYNNEIFINKIVFVILRGHFDNEMANFNSWLKTILSLFIFRGGTAAI